MNILFLYLDAFLQTGGIEKFNKAFLKAIDEISLNGNINYKAVSAYDDKPDLRYVNKNKFKGFGGSRFPFMINVVNETTNVDIVIIGHLNLAPVGLIIKLLHPRIRIILIAHGIEIWDKQPLLKSIFLKKVDLILAVSNFTKNKILAYNNIPENKIEIFPNTIDPFFKLPNETVKPEYLLKRYSLSAESRIILTITRINKHEGYKGYDKVIEVLPNLIKQIPNLKYMLGGKYDYVEGKRIKEKVKELRLENNFILTGFITEEELTDHYLLADVFILPSKKEGFGIVFIESLACGVPVIGGNQDGSIDALINGRIGKLIDPDNLNEINNSIVESISNPIADNRTLLFETFSFGKFKEKLNRILGEFT
ncbi:MAG: GDP-mannose-dependent alpha-(1-6)-phosphatidylinositol monomannoside mannosyltransferase [Ignavibacteriaceae bacterium]|nr:GDP-mannose-dependent alpha-(1-6)-phosphatidylinositol monomannoside mannosyltransferase [Ignavibacteriaceae bacterium]